MASCVLVCHFFIIIIKNSIITFLMFPIGHMLDKKNWKIQSKKIQQGVVIPKCCTAQQYVDHSWSKECFT